MRAFSLSVVAFAVALSGCSAVSYEGDLDDADVPYFFSGAMAEQKLNGTEFVVVVWSSLLDTCGLATQFLANVNDEIDDDDDVIDAIADFAKDSLPQDWWMHVVIVTAQDDDDIDGAELGDDNVSIGTIVCHFTEDIDVDDDSPDSFCGTNEQDGDIEITEFEKDDHIVIESDLDLVRFDQRTGETDDVGSLKGTGNASFCEGFSDGFDDFADACEDGEDGCSPALQKMSQLVAPVEGGSTPIEGEGEGEGEEGEGEGEGEVSCESDRDCGGGQVCDFDVGVCVFASASECVDDADCFVIDTINSPVIESDDCTPDEVPYVANGRNFCGIEDDVDGFFCVDADLATANVVHPDGFTVVICVAESAFCNGDTCVF